MPYNNIKYKPIIKPIYQIIGVFFLIFFQQLPIINTQQYAIIRLVLYVLLGVMVVVSLLNIRVKKNDFFLLFFAFVVTFGIGIHAISFRSNSGFNMIELLIPFGIFIYAISNSFSEKDFKWLLRSYVLMSLFLGVFIIVYYGVGINITTTYFLSTKNQVGPMLGYGAIISLYIASYQKNIFGFTSWFRLLLYIMFYFILILTVLIIRNRSGFLGIAISSMLIVFSKLISIRDKRQLVFIPLVLSIALVVLFVVGYLDNIFEFVYDALFKNYDFTDLNSISTGRLKGYLYGLDYIKRYPFLGEITGPVRAYTPHNYLINLGLEVGVFLSIPIILLYFSVWFIAIVYFINGAKFQSNKLLVSSMLFFSLTLSLFEYTYPYGPGVTQLIVWFLFGYIYSKEVGVEKHGFIS